MFSRFVKRMSLLICLLIIAGPVYAQGSAVNDSLHRALNFLGQDEENASRVKRLQQISQRRDSSEISPVSSLKTSSKEEPIESNPAPQDTMSKEKKEESGASSSVPAGENAFFSKNSSVENEAALRFLSYAKGLIRIGADRKAASDLYRSVMLGMPAAVVVEKEFTDFLMDQKFYYQAVAELERKRFLNEAEAGDLLNLIQCYLELELTEQAFVLAENYVSDNPHDSRGWYLLARLRMKKDERGLAAEAIKRALRGDPRNQEYITLWSRFNNEEKNLAVIEGAEKAVDDSRTETAGLRPKETVEIENPPERKKSAEITEPMKEASERKDETKNPSRTERAASNSRKDASSVIEDLETNKEPLRSSAQEEPVDPEFEGVYQRALNLQRLGLYADSLRLANRLHQRNSRSVRVLNLLGLLHYKMGDANTAAAYLRCSLELNPDQNAAQEALREIEGGRGGE